MKPLHTFDLASEQPITLRDAAKMVPSPRTDHGSISIITLRRWISEGVVGPNGEMVRLQAHRIGRSLLTSRESIMRFAQATSGSSGAEMVTHQSERSEAASRRLEAAGYR